MTAWLLDTSALLTLRDDEPGADAVTDFLRQASDNGAEVLGCFISLMEVLYRVWKDEGEHEGRLAYAQCLSLPITWVHESAGLLELAAAIKANHPLSLVDAWIAAAAERSNAVLVHKDPEFDGLTIEQQRLPDK